MPKVSKDTVVEGKRLVKGDTNPTIFDLVDKAKIIEAITNLVNGTTPASEIRERTVGGGKKAKYVNTYYMTRQASLITGFRWSSECLEEKTYPANPPYQALGAKMKVTYWDGDGNEYSHTAWGGVDVQAKGVNYFDQWKAAYSDGIKKCLSYLGIANDVYGGKDLQFFGSEPPEEETVGLEEDAPKAKSRSIDKDRMVFLKYLSDNKVSLTDAMDILGVDDLDSISDWEEALEKVKSTR